METEKFIAQHSSTAKQSKMYILVNNYKGKIKNRVPTQQL